MTEPHYLVVTLTPESIEDDIDFNFSIECPGTDKGGCNLWEECLVCRKALADLDDDTYARDDYYDDVYEGMVHGEEHMVFNGEPCVESAGCYVQAAQYCSGLDDDLWEIAREHGPGRHKIGWDGGDLDEATAFFVEEATK